MVKFPWDKINPGQGFFVPCLDVLRIRELGLKAALPYRFKAEATFGIRGGKLGVWFYVRPQASGTAARSRSPAA